MRRLLLPILGLAVLAAPAHAVTHKDVSYSVYYEGTGTYEKIDHTDYGEDRTEEEVNLQFSFDGEISDGVVFRDGHPFDKSGDDLGHSTISGDVQYRGSGGGMTCPVMAEDSWATGLMRLMEDPSEVVPLDGETHLWLRPFDEFNAMFDCGGSFPSANLASYDFMGENGFVEAGKHTFDTPFSLPREVFGMGYIEQLIPAQVVVGDRCPGRLDDTVTCKLEWSGKVSFRKLWENTVESGGGEVGPSAGPGDVPVELVPLVPKPAPPKPPVADDDDWLVPLVQQGSAKVDPGARTASVTVTCGGGCSGTASVVAAARGARAAASKPIASARFRVPAGKPTKVRVKLGAKARRSLRRSRRATLRLVFTKPTRRTRTVPLKLRR